MKLVAIILLILVIIPFYNVFHKKTLGIDWLGYFVYGPYTDEQSEQRAFKDWYIEIGIRENGVIVGRMLGGPKIDPWEHRDPNWWEEEGKRKIDKMKYQFKGGKV